MSVAGFQYAVTNGIVLVKPEHVAELADMGFAPATDEADDPNAGPGDDLAAIDNMNRNELFAWLKAKGISVAPPITVDALRAIARENAAPAAPIVPEAPTPAAEPIEAAPTAEPDAPVAAAS